MSWLSDMLDPIMNPSESPVHKRMALREKLHMGKIPVEMRREAVFAKQPPETGRPGRADSLPIKAGTESAASELPFMPEHEQPVLSAEPEIAATAKVFALPMPDQSQEPAPGSFAAEVERKLSDSRKFLVLIDEMRRLEGEKARRQKAMKETQDAYSRFKADLAARINTGDAEAGLDWLSSLRQQAQQAEKDYNTWLRQSQYVEKSEEFERIASTVQSYYQLY